MEMAGELWRAVLRIGLGKRRSSILEQIVFSKLPEQLAVI